MTSKLIEETNCSKIIKNHGKRKIRIRIKKTIGSVTLSVTLLIGSGNFKMDSSKIDENNLIIANQEFTTVVPSSQTSFYTSKNFLEGRYLSRALTISGGADKNFSSFDFSESRN